MLKLHECMSVRSGGVSVETTPAGPFASRRTGRFSRCTGLRCSISHRKTDQGSHRRQRRRGRDAFHRGKEIPRAHAARSSYFMADVFDACGRGLASIRALHSRVPGTSAIGTSAGSPTIVQATHRNCPRITSRNGRHSGRLPRGTGKYSGRNFPSAGRTNGVSRSLVDSSVTKRTAW